MSEWVHAELKVDGSIIVVATNGERVRVISMNHCFIDIPLVADRNYDCLPPQSHKMAKKKVFIEKNEMEI
jgi:hypothetical protein